MFIFLRGQKVKNNKYSFKLKYIEAVIPDKALPMVISGLWQQLLLVNSDEDSRIPIAGNCGINCP